jgi:predicted membrane protein DUF2207
LGRATVAVIAALALAGSANAADTTIPNAHVVVTVEPDGVIDVLEAVTVHAPKPYDARQEVSMNAGELFAQPSLVVAGRRRLPAISRGSRGVRISWKQPRGTTTVRLGYRLALLGVAYTDVVDVDVPLWEKDWPGRVATLTGVFRLPRASVGRVRAWLDGSYSGGFLARSQVDVRLRVHDVPAKKPLRLHVVFPRTVLTGTEGVVVKPGRGLAKILAARNHHSSSRWWWALAAVPLVILLAGIRTARSHRRPPRSATPTRSGS